MMFCQIQIRVTEIIHDDSPGGAWGKVCYSRIALLMLCISGINLFIAVAGANFVIVMAVFTGYCISEPLIKVLRPFL